MSMGRESGQSRPIEMKAAISAAAWNSCRVVGPSAHASHTASAKVSGSCVEVAIPTGIARSTQRLACV